MRKHLRLSAMEMFMEQQTLCFTVLAAKTKLPKVDYYGYEWKEDQTIDMIGFFTGGMEEFGGWFTSLNVQYKNEEGKWVSVEKTEINPPLPKTDIVFFQPHFVEYVISFSPVKQKRFASLAMPPFKITGTNTPNMFQDLHPLPS
jgi:hypothetical protein